MAIKLFGKNISPSCEYCKRGTATPDKQMVLCPKSGVVSPFYSCKKFLYDPLKRVPRNKPSIKKISDKDFSL